MKKKEIKLSSSLTREEKLHGKSSPPTKKTAGSPMPEIIKITIQKFPHYWKFEGRTK